MGVTTLDKKCGWDYRKSLLLWIGYQLKGRFGVPENFRSALRDGKVLLALLYSILPDGILQESHTPRLNDGSDAEANSATGADSPPTPPPSPGFDSHEDQLTKYLDDSLPNAAELRAERIVQLATAIGLGEFTSTYDILNCVDRVNLLFCSQLLRLFPCIDTYTILITRGIQNDYCGLHFRSPVHIGTDESFRLFGTRDTGRRCSSPLVSLVQWARQQPEESFSLIHVRDLHRVDDREASDHLIKFGVHCLENQPGSQLVGNLLDDESCLASNEHLINVTNGISDTVGTGLEELLKKIRERAHGFLIRVGVIGVSTDLQVNNLLFELQTRFGIKNLATCSALTAARTRRSHFAALDNIERFLNTNVFHSITDFTHWLAPNKTTVHLAHVPLAGSLEEGMITNIPPPIYIPSPACLRLELTKSPSRSSSQLFGRSSPPSSNSSLGRVFSILERIDYPEKHMLGSEDLLIIDALFRNASRVVIVNKLAGGFSGSMVLLAKSFDADGHEQGPFVVKLGQIDAVAQERTNFERVEEILGHQAPYVYASYEANKKAGLKFAFASHGGDVSTTTTFKTAYLDLTKDQSFLDDMLHKVAAALNRFYAAARMRTWNILESYDFDGHGWALAAGGSDEPSALAARIASLLLMNDPSEVTEAENFEFQPGIAFYNVWNLMREGEEMRRLRAWSRSQRLLVSFVHGDLNFSNILIDGSTNVWLIDFQYTTKAHYLKDLAKMENDAKMDADLQSHEDYDHAIRLTQMMHDCSPYEEKDIECQEHCDLIDSFPTKLQRACRTAFTIRSLIRQTNLGRETDLMSYHITMLRYALHSMCFHHLSNWTRKWALANACSHAQHIMERLKDFKEVPLSDDSSYGSSSLQISEGSISPP